MTLPYDLHVVVERSAGEGVEGAVHVTARENCTCRKLCLRPGVLKDGEPALRAGGETQVLAKWAEWRAGERYSYPFASSGGGDGGQRAVETEVHRAGAFEADPARVWVATPVAGGGEAGTDGSRACRRSGKRRTAATGDGAATERETPVGKGARSRRREVVPPGRSEATVERCPRCGRANIYGELRCACGHDFQPLEGAEPYVKHPRLRFKTTAGEKSRTVTGGILTLPLRLLAIGPEAHAMVVQALAALYLLALGVGLLGMALASVTEQGAADAVALYGMLAIVILTLPLYRLVAVRCPTAGCRSMMDGSVLQRSIFSGNVYYWCRRCRHEHREKVFVVKRLPWRRTKRSWRWPTLGEKVPWWW